MSRWVAPCPPMPRRRALQAGLASIAAFGALSRSGSSRAGAGETPLRVLCSGPAGSVPDLIARIVAEQWSAATGRPAVVDNRPGAAGRLSVAALKNGPVDGSTLLLAQGAIATVYPSLYVRPGYDAALDLQPVSLAGEMALGLAIGPAVPAQITTLDAFLDWARRSPEAVNIGSPGAGTLPHLLEALLFSRAGIAWQHVAYSGGPPALTQLVGGQIAALALPEGLLRPQHAAGRVRILATSGAARSVYLPQVPSFVEQGHPGLVVKEWFAFFAAGGVAAEVVAELSASLQQAITRPAVAAAFAQSAMLPVASAPSALAVRIASEQRHWQAVLRSHGIQAD